MMTTDPSLPMQPLGGRSSSVKRSRLLVPITIVAGFSLVLVGVSTAHVIRTFRGFQTTVRTDFRLKELSGSIIHIDEVLTMSARMAVSTGDPNSRWENRYNEFVPQLDDTIKETIELAPEFANSSEQVDAANLALVDMELQAFELLNEGETTQAFDLLFSPEYEQQKEVYADGIQQTLANIKQSNQDRLDYYSRALRRAAILAGLSIPMLLGSWGVVLWLIRNYIRDRNSSQVSLEKSQTELLQLVEQLGVQVQQQVEQEEAIRRESEALQQDVGSILNVVSAVEDGDFTVSAPVSDGVTGLVADTLNRLIEGLDEVLSTTLITARQAAHHSVSLGQLSMSTAEQVRQQTLAVDEVRLSMEQATDLSRNTAQQAIAANEAAQQAQQSISEGQQEMKDIDGSVSVLQEETERAIHRANTLAEFVDLAAQFATDQKRVASLTRVLAMNASMLASRASGQQDPEQFANVASEFATIAKQVNDLAVETNQGLLTLQQRTDQIQTVVSGLNRDIKGINHQVSGVSSGVLRSQQAYDAIQTATEQVANVGHQVSQSSQDIAETARVTLEAVRRISTIAGDTARRADTTLEQSAEMEQLAQSLLQTVEFFRLRQATQQSLSTNHFVSSGQSPDASQLLTQPNESASSSSSDDADPPSADSDPFPYATII